MSTNANVCVCVCACVSVSACVCVVSTTWEHRKHTRTFGLACVAGGGGAILRAVLLPNPNTGLGATRFGTTANAQEHAQRTLQHAV